MQRTDSCVVSLVAAFTSALDVFKKLRERRREKKTKSRHTKAQKALQEKSGEELRLSKSLRRGPVDIQNEYERHYQAKGERFAVGDCNILLPLQPRPALTDLETAIAQASLAETLLKLNSGLVGIISSFLRRGRKDAQLDYRSLILLSETSRQEAVDTLNRLSQRLSQSSLIPLQARHAVSTEQLSNKRRPVKGSRKGQGQATTVRKVHLFNASAPQLAIVRPRPHNRHAPSSSPSSSSFQPSPPPSYHSSPPNSPTMSTGQHPGPTYPFPPQYQTPSSDPRTTHNSLRAAAGRIPPPIPRKPTQYRQQAANLAASSPNLPTHLPPPPPPFLSPEHLPLVGRRTDRTTPSMYTFASDSTKLGEIPMEHWNVPFDFEAMERANREAALRPVPGVPVGLQGAAGERGGKRGFWGLFKKKNGGG